MCCLVRVSHTDQIGHWSVLGSGGLLINRVKAKEFGDLVPLRPPRIWDEFTRNRMPVLKAQFPPFPFHLLASQLIQLVTGRPWYRRQITQGYPAERISSQHQLRAHLWEFDYLYRTHRLALTSASDTLSDQGHWDVFPHLFKTQKHVLWPHSQKNTTIYTYTLSNRLLCLSLSS